MREFIAPEGDFVVHMIGSDDPWPVAISDGLTLPCEDCGEVPRFDYRVTDEFWRYWVPEKPARNGVVCLPCLDSRCAGVGLVDALLEIQWTGTGHTIAFVSRARYQYDNHLVNAGGHAASPREQR